MSEDQDLKPNQPFVPSIDKDTLVPKVDHAKVGPTAYGVAYLRSFSDIPLTKEFYEALKAHEANTAGFDRANRDRLAPQLEARYKLVDDLIATNGNNQIVELAAGVAPRGINLASANPDINYVEVDLPGVVGEKRAILGSLDMSLPGNLLVTEGDALSLTDIEVAISSFEDDEPITVVNEGLMRYLTFDEKTILASNVRALLQQHGGVWITPDISLRKALASEDQAAEGHTQKLKETTGIDIDKNVFEDEQHAKEFFEGLGFIVERHSFLEVTDQLVSPDKLDMTDEEVEQLNAPCVAFVMRLAA